MKKMTKRLALNRETVKQLNPVELTKAVGGTLSAGELRCTIVRISLVVPSRDVEQSWCR